jgi:UDP-2,3-diacylglucosamine pyrophosphatase LpxH
MKPNDKIIGRPIRLNRQRLNINSHKGYTEMMLIGDCHLGSPQFDRQRFEKMLDYCKEKNIYVFLMGDLIEVGTRHSVGAGVYEQEFNGQTQYDQMLEYLKPLAEKKLIVGLLAGNHEERVYKETGIDISKAFARELKVPYLGNACWNIFSVGSQRYSIYSLHGRTGSKFDGTALLALERISTSFFADVVCMGHAHKIITSSVLIQRVVNNKVTECKKHLVITGSYLKYDGGYGQTIGLPISKLGSPKVKLFADKHDLFISF